jgi:diaminopimelate epimerase
MVSNMLRFTKMHGAGNDFVIINNLRGDVTLSGEQIASLCDRRLGVGADGILLLEQPQTNADFRMRYYNTDGGEVEMCGNGARCFARFASREAGPFDSLKFETPAGLINARIAGNQVTIGLSAPRNLDLRRTIDLGDGKATIHSINTGVPHAVLFVDHLAQTPVTDWGSKIRRHAAFQPSGTNANFVEILGPGRLQIRTYERGVEDETLACGTGVVASALVYAALKNIPSPIAVQVKGGDWLEVAYCQHGNDFQEVQLSGPATFVFEGTADCVS